MHTVAVADPTEIADRAMALAGSFLQGATQQIVAMADGDMNALYEAAQIVRNRAMGPTTEHSAEHLAFSLITAAHSQLRMTENPHDRR